MSPHELAAQLHHAEGVAFAMLFGSRARGTARPDSDWDVGIHFRSDLDARQRMEIRRALAADMPIGEKVDLVDLNAAPPLLAHRALMGQRLVVNDKRAFVRFFVKTMGEAEDERYFGAILRRAMQERLEEGRFGRP